MRASRWLAWAAGAGVAAGLVVAGLAGAQTTDVQRPRTILVGTPSGGARTDRMDNARSGRSETPLPAAQAGLRSDWRTVVSVTLDVAPVVDVRGTTYAVGSRGEVFAVARDGSEQWKIATGGVQPSAPVLLSDDTLVFVDAAGEAVAVREGAIRWRVRFGRADPSRPIPPAPVALDDGGVVIATPRDLAALDAEGHERARTTLPEATTVPLLATGALGKIVAVTSSGAVWTWTPGSAEMARVGSFGGAIDDSAVLADDHTVMALAAGRTHLVTVDLVRGTTTTRATLPAGLWLGPPAMRAGFAHLFIEAPTSELAVVLDPAGTEVSRALLTTHPPPIAADGGIGTLVASPHTPLLVDTAGNVAFATAEGAVGVVSGGVVDRIADVCPAAPAGPKVGAPVTALVPLGPNALLVACRAGTLVTLQSSPTPAKP